MESKLEQLLGQLSKEGFIEHTQEEYKRLLKESKFEDFHGLRELTDIKVANEIVQDKLDKFLDRWQVFIAQGRGDDWPGLLSNIFYSLLNIEEFTPSESSIQKAYRILPYTEIEHIFRRTKIEPEEEILIKEHTHALETGDFEYLNKLKELFNSKMILSPKKIDEYFEQRMRAGQLDHVKGMMDYTKLEPPEKIVQDTFMFYVKTKQYHLIPRLKKLTRMEPSEEVYKLLLPEKVPVG
jgi:hypothetical protein